MNKFIRKYWKIIIFTLSMTIFLLLVKLLLKDEVEIFDTKIYSIVSTIKCEPVTAIFKFLSFLCSTWFILFTTIIVMISCKNKKIGFYLGLNVLICVLLNQGLKLIFARTRPIDINLIIESGYSFPSGHSMVSLAFYGFFIYIIAHMNISKKRKLIFCTLLAILTLSIGISRIYLGVHYASDVIAGFSLSMAYLIIYISIFYNKMTDEQKEPDNL